MERARRELEEAHQADMTALRETLAEELQEQRRSLAGELARAREAWEKEREAATRVAVDRALEAARRDWQIHLETEVESAVRKPVTETSAAGETEVKKQACRLEEQRQKIQEPEKEKASEGKRKEKTEDCLEGKQMKTRPRQDVEEVLQGKFPEVRPVITGGQAAISSPAVPPVSLQKVGQDLPS